MYYAGGDQAKEWLFLTEGMGEVAYCGKNVPPATREDPAGFGKRFRPESQPPGCRRPYGIGPGFCNHDKQVSMRRRVAVTHSVCAAEQ